VVEGDPSRGLVRDEDGLKWRSWLVIQRSQAPSVLLVTIPDEAWPQARVKGDHDSVWIQLRHRK
jgi:hypothetical protein